MTDTRETCPSRRGSSRAAARDSASRRYTQNPPKVAERVSAERRASRRSMACSRVSRCSGRCGEGAERLLEVPHGLAVGRPRQGLLPRLPAVRQGLGPHLPPQGMMGQPFDLLGHPVPGERLQGLNDAGMQGPPPLLQEAPVGHLVRESMLEGVLVLREETRLVEKFSGLEAVPGCAAGVPRGSRRWPAAVVEILPCQ